MEEADLAHDTGLAIHGQHAPLGIFAEDEQTDVCPRAVVLAVVTYGQSGRPSLQAKDHNGVAPLRPTGRPPARRLHVSGFPWAGSVDVIAWWSAHPLKVPGAQPCLEPPRARISAVWRTTSNAVSESASRTTEPHLNVVEL